MLRKHLPPGVDQKAFKKLKAMPGREVFFLMSRRTFAAFLRQLGHTPNRFTYGTAGYGSNVEYELRMRISSTDVTNMTGMVGLPRDSLLDYLELLHTMLLENGHSLELSPPPQRETLPPAGRDGNFPGGNLLNKYIYEGRSTADGSVQ